MKKMVRLCVVVGIAIVAAASSTMAEDDMRIGSNGSSLQGVDANGSQQQGSSQQGSNQQGVDTNGSNPQGLSLNGANPNGLSPQGLSPNGMSPQGIRVHGIMPNGTQLQGPRTNAHGAAPARSTGLRLDAVHVVGGKLVSGPAPSPRAQKR